MSISDVRKDYTLNLNPDHFQTFEGKKKDIGKIKIVLMRNIFVGNGINKTVELLECGIRHQYIMMTKPLL